MPTANLCCPSSDAKADDAYPYDLQRMCVGHLVALLVYLLLGGEVQDEVPRSSEVEEGSFLGCLFRFDPVEEILQEDPSEKSTESIFEISLMPTILFKYPLP